MKDIDSSMTKRLLSLSLFQGLTTEQLMDILTKTRIEFVNVKDDYILREGQRHEQMVFVIQGTILREYREEKGLFTFFEEIGTDIIEPESLFGRDTTLRANYWASGSVTLVVFDKRNLFNVFNHFGIVQINILNSFCATIQSLQQKEFIPSGKNIGTSFCQFVSQLSTHPLGEKKIDITRTDLAVILGCNRRAMSEMLVTLEKEGLISIGYRLLTIPDLEALRQRVAQSDDSSISPTF